MKFETLLIALLIGCGASANVPRVSPTPAEPTEAAEPTEVAEPTDPATTAPLATDDDSAEGTQIWTIAAVHVDCVGVAPRRCMRIQDESGEWTLFYDSIEGLEVVEGTEYSVRVRQEDVPNPPADASSIRTILVEVLSQNEVTAQGTTTTCTSSRDCPEGQLCAGDEGCDTPWTCQPPRPCTRDLRAYCTCDGRTVRGSGSCPPEPFRSRGACAP